MVRSRAVTVGQYLEGLPAPTRREIATVRDVILENLPAGYTETMQYGMVSYVVPLARYPDTYNKQPLAVAALAAQKNYNSLYLMSVYGDPAHAKWFEAAYRASGKRLDMGKACVRFRRAEDLPLDVVAEAVARVPVDAYVAMAQQVRPR